MQNTLAGKNARTIRLQRLLAAVMVVAMLAALVVMPAAGAFDSISNKLTGIIQELYQLLMKIAIPAAVLALSWAAIKMFLGGQRNMEEAKKSVFVVVIVVLIVLMAPVLIKELVNAFKPGAGAWTELNAAIPTLS